jgi:hypothetical protein
VKAIFIGFILAILLDASSALAAKCDVQMNNLAGDIIDSYTDWWDLGSNGFQNYVYINGVQNDEYGIERLPASYPCTRFCGPFRFVAKTPNVRIHVEVVSGNSSGWRCAQVAYVVGHVQPQIDPVRQQKKNRARANESYFMTFTTTVGVSLPVWCALDPFVTCPILTSIGAYSAWLTWASGKVANDPLVPGYDQPYEPNYGLAGNLGLTYAEVPYVNALNDDLTWIVIFADFIHESTNRESSCVEANHDCQYWQKERVDYGYDWLGYYLWHSSQMLNGMAYYLRDDLGTAPELVQPIFEAANQAWEAAGEYQQ